MSDRRPVPRETLDPFEAAVLYAIQRAAAKRRRAESRAKMGSDEAK